MAIGVGDRLPAASFQRMGAAGVEEVKGDALFGGRKVAVFAVPGAYTGVCTNQHMPSFVKAAADLRKKGVHEIACISVNDPFVMQAWGASTGATAAGITVLADPDAAFTRAVGMEFSAPPVGLHNRSKRYSMLVEDGVVKVLNLEDSPGNATCSLGEVLVDQI
jgi:cytochrome c peroxidase